MHGLERHPFFNSEVWGAYAQKHVEELMVIDNMILQTVVGAQSKVQVETLYLETSTLFNKPGICHRPHMHACLKFLGWGNFF